MNTQTRAHTRDTHTGSLCTGDHYKYQLSIPCACCRLPAVPRPSLQRREAAGGGRAGAADGGAGPEGRGRAHPPRPRPQAGPRHQAEGGGVQAPAGLPHLHPQVGECSVWCRHHKPCLYCLRCDIGYTIQFNFTHCWLSCWDDTSLWIFEIVTNKMTAALARTGHGLGAGVGTGLFRMSIMKITK